MREWYSERRAPANDAKKQTVPSRCLVNRIRRSEMATDGWIWLNFGAISKRSNLFPASQKNPELWTVGATVPTLDCVHHFAFGSLEENIVLETVSEW